MMNSSFDDEDDFLGANPFRSSSGHPEGDLLGTPNPPSPQQPAMMMPDPNTGFTGEVNLPPPPQAPPPARSPYGDLSGTMDTSQQQSQSQHSGGSYGSNGSTEIPSTSYSIFSWRACVACCRLDSYTQYFDVDTSDVTRRVRAALTQFYQPDQFRTAVLGEAPSQESPSDENNLKGPDLYGPFWIAMTLIFCIAVTSNLSAYMHSKVHWSHTASALTNSTDYSSSSSVVDAEFEYDIHHLLRALSVIGTFSFGLPTAFWLAANCMGMPGVSWALWICVYGYSLVPVVLASLVAWIPIELLEWLVLAIACTASCLLVVRNLSTLLLQQDSASHTKAAPFILAILGAHFIFCCVLKFTFYP